MKFLFTLSLFLFGLLSVNAQSSVRAQEKLQHDLVVEDGQRFVFEQLTLLSSKTLESVQIRIYAEADKSFISRDQFLANVISISQMIMSGVYSGNELASYTIKDLDHIDGAVDINVEFMMTAEGVKVKVRNGAIEKKETLSWDELI